MRLDQQEEALEWRIRVRLHQARRSDTIWHSGSRSRRHGQNLRQRGLVSFRKYCHAGSLYLLTKISNGEGDDCESGIGGGTSTAVI